jgi:hypothetical protein
VREERERKKYAVRVFLSCHGQKPQYYINHVIGHDGWDHSMPVLSKQAQYEKRAFLVLILSDIFMVIHFMNSA